MTKKISSSSFTLHSYYSRVVRELIINLGAFTMRINFSSFSILLVITVSIVCLSLISCEPAAKSASQAFDNANSVIKSGSNVLFIDTTPTAVPLKPAVPTK